MAKILRKSQGSASKAKCCLLAKYRHCVIITLRNAKDAFQIRANKIEQKGYPILASSFE